VPDSHSAEKLPHDPGHSELLQYMTQSVQIKILLVDDFSASLKARKKQNFLDDLSISGPAVRLYREGRAIGPPTPLQEEARYKIEDRYRRTENS